MTLFDGFSIVARVLPRGFVATVLVLAWFVFPNAARTVFMQAVHEEAAQITSTLQHALDPRLRQMMLRNHGCSPMGQPCQAGPPRH